MFLIAFQSQSKYIEGHWESCFMPNLKIQVSIDTKDTRVGFVMITNSVCCLRVCLEASPNVLLISCHLFIGRGH